MTTRRLSPFQTRLRLWAGDGDIKRGTNRPGHLKLNRFLSLGLVGIALIHIPAGPGPVAWWLGVAAVCRATEVFITPDVDSAESWGGSRGGRACRAWWWIYGKKTPHRHWTSHSLLIGLPIRLAWAGLPVLVAGVGTLLILWKLGYYSTVVEVQNAILDALYLADRFHLGRMIEIGAGVSDLGHYLLDDFNLIEMFFGKGD
jgi:uncharacterized metal-binding protein